MGGDAEELAKAVEEFANRCTDDVEDDFAAAHSKPLLSADAVETLTLGIFQCAGIYSAISACDADGSQAVTVSKRAPPNPPLSHSGVAANRFRAAKLQRTSVQSLREFSRFVWRQRHTRLPCSDAHPCSRPDAHKQSGTGHKLHHSGNGGVCHLLLCVQRVPYYSGL